MTPLSSASFLRSFLAAALLLSAAPIFASITDPAVFHGRITREDSLTAAQELLANQAFRDTWKASDPKTYAEAFAAATELQDIGDLLMGLSDPRAIRLGLKQREHCKFCSVPAKLETWFKKEIPWADATRIKTLREATWAWEFIPPDAIPSLTIKALDRAEWEKLDFPARMNHIGEWSDAELADMLTTTPRTQAEQKAMEARAWTINGTAGNSDRARLWERVNHAKMAVDGLARAEKLVGLDPARRQALEDARGADLDGMLAGLNGLFDAAGVKDPALRAAAPPKEGQRFDDASRGLVAGLLRTGLMNETKGTYAGRELTEFYQSNTLDLRIEATTKGREHWIGWHQGGVITFNQKHIEDYLKAEGKDIKDIAREPELLRRLTVQLAPLFVHEATHQRQMVWARENKLPWVGGQHLELETMQVAALFIVEKRRNDPSFDAILQRDKETSLLARESLSNSDRIVNGVQSFRDSINALHYPDLLSLEGATERQVRGHREMARDIEKELARRDALPKAERKRLEKVPGFLYRSADDAAWEKALVVAGTETLRNSLAVQKGGLEKMPGTYDAYRRRLESVNNETAERLSMVLKAPPPNTGFGRTIPPSPERR